MSGDQRVAATSYKQSFDQFSNIYGTRQQATELTQMQATATGKRPDHGPVQCSPKYIFSSVDWNLKHYSPGSCRALASHNAHKYGRVLIKNMTYQCAAGNDHTEVASHDIFIRISVNQWYLSSGVVPENMC